MYEATRKSMHFGLRLSTTYFRNKQTTLRFYDLLWSLLHLRKTNDNEAHTFSGLVVVNLMHDGCETYIV